MCGFFFHCCDVNFYLSVLFRRKQHNFLKRISLIQKHTNTKPKNKHTPGIKSCNHEYCMRTLRNTVMYKSMKLIDNHFYTFQMVMCIFATFQLELYSMYSLLFFVPLYININVSIKGVLVILHLLLFYFCAHPLFSNLFSTGGKEVNTRAMLGITSAD